MSCEVHLWEQNGIITEPTTCQESVRLHEVPYNPPKQGEYDPNWISCYIDYPDNTNSVICFHPLQGHENANFNLKGEQILPKELPKTGSSDGIVFALTALLIISFVKLFTWRKK